jgi:hypothetical protein
MRARIPRFEKRFSFLIGSGTISDGAVPICPRTIPHGFSLVSVKKQYLQTMRHEGQHRLFTELERVARHNILTKVVYIQEG